MKSVIELKIKSVDKNIKYYCHFISKLLKNLNIEYNLINLPKKVKRITLLKSPHVNKKAMEHFEIRIYKVLIKISNPNINLRILKLLVLNKPKFIKLSLRKII
jgi:ribosomal protein S10